MTARCLGFAVIAFLPLSARTADPPPAGDGATIRAKDPPEPPVVSYAGRVTAISKDSITLQPNGGWWTIIPIDANGRAQMHLATKEWRPGPPRRTFGYTPMLAAGKMNTVGRNTYLPADVRVGDGVEIGCEEVGGKSLCAAIVIGRRPGGYLPPAHNSKLWPDDPSPHHAIMNAYADLDERGIPLPDWMISERVRSRREVAPEPREVLPTPIPSAAP